MDQLSRDETDEYIEGLDGVDATLVSPVGRKLLLMTYEDATRAYESGDLDGVRRALDPIRAGAGLFYMGSFRGGSSHAGLDEAASQVGPAEVLTRLKQLVLSAGSQPIT